MKATVSSLTVLFFLLLAHVTLPPYTEAQPQAGKKESSRAWLGVVLGDVRSGEAKEGKTTDKGVLVQRVSKDSPAEKAGLKKGDIITAFKDRQINSADDLVTAVREAKAGERISLSMLREGKQSNVTVELGERPAREREQRVITRSLRLPRTPIPDVLSGRSNSIRDYGMTLRTLTSQLGEYFGAPEGKGVLVERVEDESAAANAGFKAGDVIVRAGKKTIATVHDLRNVLGAYDAGEKIPMHIIRKGAKLNMELLAKEAKTFDRDIGPRLGGVFRFHADEDGDSKLDLLEGLDDLLEDIGENSIDIGDMVKDRVHRMRIQLDGKRLELDGLDEALRESMETLREQMKELQDDGVSRQSRQIRIRSL
jgi:hypothetical protein